MAIQLTCPHCEKRLSVQEDLAGKKVRCGGCQRPVQVPSRSRAEDDDDNPRMRRRAEDEDSDRPRRKSGKKRTAGKGALVWVLLGVGVLALVLLGVGGLVASRFLLGAKDTSLAAVGEATSRGATEAAGVAGTGNKESGGPKYVPRVSEQKLQDFLKDKNQAAYSAVTDDQVYAIMGPPTRRDNPITGQKNGVVITVYTAYWEEPGSGVKSQIGFVNGRLSGMVLGLEVNPK